MVKEGRERELWADVLPEMMSDEELNDDGTFIRHPPSYRSKAFDKFINKLDLRLACMPSIHPRGTRQVGSPRERQISRGSKKWLYQENENEEEEEELNQDEHNLNEQDSLV